MRGRGDLLLELRLLLRPQALLGLAVALAGLAALVGAYMPWYEVAMEVSYRPWQEQGVAATQQAPAAWLSGWQAHAWGWLVPAVAVAVVVVGLLSAIDRPPPRHDRIEIGAGLVLAVFGGLGVVLVPAVERFGGERVAVLSDLARRLPDGLEMGLEVRPASGLWVTLAAAALLAGLGLATRRT